MFDVFQGEVKFSTAIYPDLFYTMMVNRWALGLYKNIQTNNLDIMVPRGTLITVHRGLLRYQIDWHATPEFQGLITLILLQLQQKNQMT